MNPMKYLSNFLVSIDQLGNVLAGGNPDNTISSRVGYYTEKHYNKGKIPAKWRIFKKIINFSFYPIDGKDHCKEAYYNDAGENFDPKTSDWAIAILAILIVPSCLLISIFLYFLFAIGIVSPKRINRTENVKKRLDSALGKLNGVHTELNEYKVKVDDELNNILTNTDEVLEEITSKIAGILNLKKRLEIYKTRKRNIDDNKA